MDPWIWTIVFLLAGLLFAVLELFLPSGGILAFFSFASFCASVIFSFHQGVGFGLVYTVILLVGIPILVWQLVNLWPYTPIGRRILLDPKNDPALDYNPEKDSFQHLVGKVGTALSQMVPSGIVLIDNQRYDALTEGEAIDPGTPIIVLKASRLDIVVRSHFTSKEEQTSQNTPSLSDPVVSDPFR